MADGEAAVLLHESVAQLRAVAVGRHEEERIPRRELQLARERAGGASAAAQQHGGQECKRVCFIVISFYVFSVLYFTLRSGCSRRNCSQLSEPRREAAFLPPPSP